LTSGKYSEAELVGMFVIVEKSNPDYWFYFEKSFDGWCAWKWWL